jgi:hypothetical protein
MEQALARMVCCRNEVFSPKHRVLRQWNQRTAVEMMERHDHLSLEFTGDLDRCSTENPSARDSSRFVPKIPVISDQIRDGHL